MASIRDKLPTHPEAFTRVTVNSLLKEAVGHPLVTVSAGVGYGKTQNIAAFARDTKDELIWLHLLKYDNIPSRFWESFVEAVQPEFEDLAIALEELDFPVTHSEFDHFLTVFQRFLENEQRVLFVIDDYTKINNHEVKLFFQHLIDAKLENISLLFIGTTDDHLDLPTAVAPYKIGGDDLRFSKKEISEYYSSYNISLSDEVITQIADYTEGLPLPIYLILQSSKNDLPFKIDAEKPLATFCDDLFDALFYAALDRRTQHLLISMSLFDYFPASIMKNMDEYIEGETEKVLDTVFFITYDAPSKIYHLQRAFHEFLRKKQKALSSEEIERLYKTVGDWYFENGFIYEAIDYAYARGDYGQMMYMVKIAPEIRKSKGYADYILSVLASLPKEYAKDNPEVVFAQATMHLNNLQTHTAKELFLQLRDSLESSGAQENKDLLGEVYLALSDISLLLNDHGFLKYIKKAYELIPDGSRYRSSSLMYAGNNDTFFLPNNHVGIKEQMVKDMLEAGKLYNKLINGSGAGFDYLYAAESAFFVGDMNEAKEQASRAIYSARNHGQHDIILNAYFVLMRIAMIEGGYQQLLDRFWIIENYVSTNNLPLLSEIRDCIDGIFHIRMADFEKVPEWIRNRDNNYYASPLVEAGRNRLLYIYYLRGTGKIQEVIDEFVEMDQIFDEKGLWTIRLMKNIMLADCYLQLGEKEHALRHFHMAYDMSYQNNVYIPYLEYGPPVQELINLAKNSEEYDFDHNWLSKVYKEIESYMKRAIPVVEEYYKQKAKG